MHNRVMPAKSPPWFFVG